MAWKTIEKPRQGWPVVPNLLDYEQTRAQFSWETAGRALDGLPGGRGLNIAHEAVDRHAAGPHRDHLAIRWLGKRGEMRDFTYADLRAVTNRFANVLAGLGVGRGDMVCVLAGRIPELYAVVGERLVDLSGPTSPGAHANPLQAWASAGLLDMVSRPGAQLSP